MRRRQALNNSILELRFKANKKQKIDLDLFLNVQRKSIEAKLKHFLRKHGSLKFDFSVQVELEKLDFGTSEDDQIVRTRPWFNSGIFQIINKFEIDRKITAGSEKILNGFDNFIRMGSGWYLSQVLKMDFRIYKFRPLRGGGRTDNADLPPPYNKMSSIISFKQKDNKCFLYCVLAELYPAKRRKRDYKQYQKHERKINTTSLKYPVKTNEISGFEKDNNLSINIYILRTKDKKKKKECFPTCIRISENDNADKHINLLLHNSHYHLIHNMTPFLGYKTYNRRLQCRKCLRFSKTQAKLSKHVCNINKPCLKFPHKTEKLQFQNFQNITKSSFVMYADLETYSAPVQCQDDTATKTKKLSRHRASAFGLYCVCTEEEFSDKRPEIYVGEDAIEKLFEALQRKIDKIEKIQQTVNFPIEMTRDDEKQFLKAKNCYICGTRFQSQCEKLRDHNHLKRKKNFLGSVCIGCNLNRSDLKLKIPLFFHNAGKFDIHLLVEKFHLLSNKKINVLSRTNETFISISLFGGSLRIQDSFNHLANSLADLVELGKKSGQSFYHTKKAFGKDLEMITGKGVFPHSFVTSFDQLKETKKLPGFADFYDKLQEKNISEEDYCQAKKIWQHFSCQNLEEYMKIYLICDVTLLADVFESYRDFFSKKFNLDPASYVSLPSLCFDCALFFTKAKIDYIYDEETYVFIKKSIRGGVSTVTRRFAETNTPSLPNFDPMKPDSCIYYFDCNSLYSSIMTMKLPYKDFRFIEPSKITKRDILNYQNEDNVGYLIECNLKYPKKIHDETKDLPLVPRQFEIKQEHLSPYNRELVEKLNIQTSTGTKLLADQFDKDEIICHIANLKFYLERGMKLQKITKVLRFKQKAIFEPYIRLCIEERSKTNSAIEKNLWKLACNSIFGKTITNLEKRNVIKFVTDENQMKRRVANPFFKSASIINSKLVQTNCGNQTLSIKSPYIIGTAVLDLSKLVLYDFHYNFFRKLFGNSCRLLMTDTDSLMYLFTLSADYVNFVLRENDSKFDFSNYPPDHPLFNTKNKGKLFCIKDEVAGKRIKSFVGLRAKNYALSFDNDTCKITGKGIPKRKLKEICFDEMKEVLFTKIQTSVDSNQIRSFKHKLYNIKQEKISLSPFDNKRYVLSDGIETLPLGHYKTVV